MRAKRFSSCANAFFLLIVVLLLPILPVPAHAQTFTVLHTFEGTDGAEPVGVLVLDSAGNIYGTTGIGGGGTKCPNFSNSGCGSAFALNKAGREVGLHSFNGPNGAGPDAGLVRDAAGDFFGTTVGGGMNAKACGGTQGYGCGIAFRLTKTGKETMYEFKGTPDGSNPQAPLVEDPAGNLYGTTPGGGANQLGAVFKIDTHGREAILYSFAGPPAGGSDGAFSYNGVIRDAAGNLYGVTFAGGMFGEGAVYELNTAGEETLLHSFAGGSDGAQPDSALLLDTDGNLYGTTANGGNGECGGTGCGVIFELSPQSGGGWTETVFYTFCSLSGCADGKAPLGPLVRGSSGSLYGVTYFGGTPRDCNGDGCGVVFEVDKAGKETVLHSFTGGSDGAFPAAGLTIDNSGNLYGTTEQGGAICYTSFTCGVVFKITP
jgi:uncharacterized repeat protein (TIGR03803 family)